MAVHGWRRAYHRALGWHAPALRRAAVVLVIDVVATLLLLLGTPWELAVILGWDLGAAAFLASTGQMIIRADAADTQALASQEDATRTAGAVVLLSACTVSLLGVGFAIHLAGQRSDGLRVALIAVAVLTVLVSWITLNFVFVLRYAHLWYGPARGGIGFVDSDTQAGPTYRDLAYVAFTVGMTYQVSDTVLRNPRMRQTVLSHAALAYVFGVVIIAGAINLIAGLMR